MGRYFSKKKLSPKLGFRTPDFFKRRKKYRLRKILVKPIQSRGAQPREQRGF